MSKQKRSVSQVAQQGFTIVELMVATLVFAVILVVITVGVLHFTNAYYRGVNSSSTQNTARSIIDTVSQAVQFGGGDFGCTPTTAAPPPNNCPNATTYCIGNLQFDFLKGRKLDGSAVKDALYQSPHNGAGCTAVAGLAGGVSVTNGKELLANNMRLSDLKVTKLSNGLYSIAVRIAYGDDDLFCVPSLNGATGGCKQGDGPMTSAILLANVSAIQCKSTAGSQFCAISELSTTVQTRIGG